MRVATVDGLITLFYDGSKELWNLELISEWVDACRLKSEDADLEAPNLETLDLSNECKRYIKERLYWQQIIVVDDITEIPEFTFAGCYNVKRVIITDTIIRIKRCAFIGCKNLVSIKWSLRLEYIGEGAFRNCNLSSVFMPPLCRQIGPYAFAKNANLTILNVSEDTELGTGIIKYTELFEKYSQLNDGPLNTWLQNINHNDQFDLHRVCSSFEPTLDMILDIMKEKGGPKAFSVVNGIGITPSRYLKENQYAEVTEKDIIKKYVLQMTGEVVNDNETP